MDKIKADKIYKYLNNNMNNDVSKNIKIFLDNLCNNTVKTKLDDDLLIEIVIILINYGVSPNNDVIHVIEELCNFVITDNSNKLERSMVIKLFTIAYIDKNLNLEQIKSIYEKFENKDLALSACFVISSKNYDDILNYIEKYRTYFVDEYAFYASIVSLVHKIGIAKYVDGVWVKDEIIIEQVSNEQDRLLLGGKIDEKSLIDIPDKIDEMEREVNDVISKLDSYYKKLNSCIQDSKAKISDISKSNIEELNKLYAELEVHINKSIQQIGLEKSIISVDNVDELICKLKKYNSSIGKK